MINGHESRSTQPTQTVSDKRPGHLVYAGVALILLAMPIPPSVFGQHWEQIDLATDGTIRAIEHGSFSNRWMVGDSGYVAVSDLERTAWTADTVFTTVDLYSVRRPASSQVWVSGDSGKVRVLINGNWSARDAPTTERVVLYSRESGCQNALGDQGGLFQTCDFGVNWDTLDSGVSSSLNYGAGFITSRSWIVGDGGTILFSTDGGDTWAPQDSGTLADLNFIVEAGNGWNIAVGSSGTIVRTNDLGVTWSIVPTPTTEDLWSVATSGLNAAWLIAAGTNGTVLKTTDNGESWCSLNAESDVDFFATSMPDNNEHIVAGAGGTMMRTTDGGGGCQSGVAVEEDPIPGVDVTGPYPLPLAAEGRLDLTLSASQTVRATTYDMLGRRVRSVFEGNVVAGVKQRIDLDAADMPAGFYLVRIEGETFSASRTFPVAH